MERDDHVGLTLERYPLRSGPSVRYFALERSQSAGIPKSRR
jgi:hypothetical protein